MTLPLATLHWIDARSATEAVTWLQQPGAQPLAAGGDLFGLLKEGVHGPAMPAPTLLVNLGTVPELRRSSRDAEGWHLGAMLTLQALASTPGLPPLLLAALPGIASPQLRARTTLGGNLLQRPRCLWFRHPGLVCFKKGGDACLAREATPEAHPGALWPGRCVAGHPSDLAPALIALGAEAELRGAGGVRRLPLEQLFEGAAVRAGPEAELQPDELLCTLHLPKGVGDDGKGQAFEKLAARDANEFAWASVALRLACTDDGRIADAHVVVGGVAPAPWRWVDATTHLVGRRLADLDLPALSLAMLPETALTRRHGARATAARVALQRAVRQLLLQRSAPAIA